MQEFTTLGELYLQNFIETTEDVHSPDFNFDSLSFLELRSGSRSSDLYFEDKVVDK